MYRDELLPMIDAFEQNWGSDLIPMDIQAAREDVQAEVENHFALPESNLLHATTQDPRSPNWFGSQQDGPDGWVAHPIGPIHPMGRMGNSTPIDNNFWFSPTLGETLSYIRNRYPNVFNDHGDNDRDVYFAVVDPEYQANTDTE